MQYGEVMSLFLKNVSPTSYVLKENFTCFVVRRYIENKTLYATAFVLPLLRTAHYSTGCCHHIVSTK
jgi:hypothetical protein